VTTTWEIHKTRRRADKDRKNYEMTPAAAQRDRLQQLLWRRHVSIKDRSAQSLVDLMLTPSTRAAVVFPSAFKVSADSGLNRSSCNLRPILAKLFANNNSGWWKMCYFRQTSIPATFWQFERCRLIDTITR